MLSPVGPISTTELEDGAITAAKINSSAVTTVKINTSAVTTAKIAGSAITTTLVNSSAITEAKINTGAVTNTKIDASAVTAVKLNASALDYIKYHGQTSKTLSATGLCSIATPGFTSEGVIAIPWTDGITFVRLHAKPTTSVAVLRFGEITATGVIEDTGAITCSFYYEYMRP